MFKKGTDKVQVRAKQSPEVENVFDIALFYCLTKGGKSKLEHPLSFRGILLLKRYINIDLLGSSFSMLSFEME